MKSFKTFYLHNLATQEPLKLRDDITIGRSDNADITINDDKISGKHLHITMTFDAVFIKDLKTSNGTVLNGIEVKPHEKYEVFEGSKIKIGRVTLVLSENSFLDYENFENETEKTVKKTYTHSLGSQFDGASKIELNLFEKDNFFEANSGGNKKEKVGRSKKTDKLDKVYTESVEEANMDIFDAQVREVKRNIRNNVQKIGKLQGEVKSLELKLKRKVELQKDLEDLENTNEDLFVEGPKLKEKYENNIEEWNGINLKIKKLERELNKVKKLREDLDPVMGLYELYLERSKQKQDFAVELKRIVRERPGDKKLEFEERIANLEKDNVNFEKDITEIDKEREKAKEREKQKIKDQIAELQKKLDKAS